MHMSKQDDQVKEQLANVNELWVKYQLVLYSPTISAGVDFSVEHFDRMYFYMCRGSCSPLGALQMTGRVRKLRDRTIWCLAGYKIHPMTDSRPVLPSEMLEYVRWVDTSSMRQQDRVQLEAEGETEQLVTVPDRSQMVVRVPLRPTTPLMKVSNSSQGNSGGGGV